jgi:hypothetical protein
MSEIFANFRTPEEKYWDETYEAHLRDECYKDCPLCREEKEAEENG